MLSAQSAGKGGQHRNKVETAVRLMHIPTGVEVTASEQRNQYQNRQKARERLQQQLDSLERSRGHESMNAVRAGQFEHDADADRGQCWTWTNYRDEVKTPAGKKAVMSRALKGKFGKLLKN